MYLLETIHIGSDLNLVDCRFPVQYVIRPNNGDHHDYRGYAGRIAGGVFKPGDKVMVLPSGFTTRIKAIEGPEGNVTEAFAPMSVTILLEDELDVSRGDMIVREKNVPRVSQDLDVMICWMNPRKLQLNGKYGIRSTTKDARCVIKDILYKVDINTLHRIQDYKEVGMNDIARIALRTTKPFFTDKYLLNRITGSLILTEEGTNETVAAGMVI